MNKNEAEQETNEPEVQPEGETPVQDEALTPEQEVDQLKQQLLRVSAD